MDLLPILQQHLSRYPAMTAQDCVKLLYQAVLGPAHLGRMGTPPPDYIINEMKKAPKRNLPLTESIGNGLCRLNLDSIHNHLRGETIHTLFLATAEEHQGTLDELKEQLTLWKNNSIFSEEETTAELLKLEESNYAPVSHSQPYHSAYDPHYRLISERFIKYFPLLERIDQRLMHGEKTLLAIDGRCASGKTTLAALLSKIYACSVIHIDDFFLPFERKTKERLAEPGGNLDRERFYEEINLPYRNNQDLIYGQYDCSCGAITRQESIPQQPVIIVEGSYCLHPLMQDAYDIKVFSTCSSELQSQRILHRNGEQMHHRFLKEWIPMEEQYFSHFSIPQICDFILSTD